MPKLKTLSGADVLKIFALFGFSIAAQKGSYAKLRRISRDGTKQILTISLHEELDKGTLTAIYKQALRYIPESELRSHFYAEQLSTLPPVLNFLKQSRCFPLYSTPKYPYDLAYVSRIILHDILIHARA